MQEQIDNLMLLLDSPLFNRIVLVLFSVHVGLLAGLFLGEEKGRAKKGCTRDRIA